VEAPAVATDASLTSKRRMGRRVLRAAADAAHADVPVPKRPPFRAQPELVAMPGRFQAEEHSPESDEPPRFASRNWRAEAWDRERERERAAERHPDRAARRRLRLRP
jgi:hypothetical protein